MKKSLIIAIALLLISKLPAQTVQNLRVEQHTDTVLITYDLISSLTNDIFSVNLFVSENNGETFSITPKTVEGDIGYGIPPGFHKQIIWLPLEDSLELVGDDYIFKIQVASLGASKEVDFVLVKGGWFEMGSKAKEAKSDERPVHRVYVDDFKMSINEITNYQFLAFLQEYGSRTVRYGEYRGEVLFYSSPKGILIQDRRLGGEIWRVKKGYEFYPVVGVTWYGANEFCKFYGYRLPTEAEWEYAAREGGKNVRFGNGKDIADPSEINFNGSREFKKKYSIVGQNRKSTIRVCSFPPNKLQLFDMSGNVWEWCQDWYQRNYYFHSKIYNPTGPWFGKYKVIRGGSWFNSAEDIRTTDRSFFSPYSYNHDIGFRVVQDVKQNKDVNYHE